MTDPNHKVIRTYFDPLGRSESQVLNLKRWDMTFPTPPSIDMRTDTETIITQAIYDAMGANPPYPAPGIDTSAGAYPAPESSGSLWDQLVDFFVTLFNPQPASAASLAKRQSGALLSFAPQATDPLLTQQMDYQYDALNRLTAANYSDGHSFQYTYDGVGNRMSETTLGGSKTYTYDAANRLTGVGGVSYTWDHNGNLTGDGASNYTYDQANRLVKIEQNGTAVATYGYNGLGDRLKENGTPFVLDLNAGLTQVLQDGANTYLYGSERIAQFDGSNPAYFLGDALGSVRQLVDESGAVTLTKSYEPYGQMLSSVGSAPSNYAFTGEWASSSTNLLYLRSRYYSGYLNQFIQPDGILPDPYRPEQWNRYSYVDGNPVNLTDPSEKSPDYCSSLPESVHTRMYECQGSYDDYRDLTDWLYRVMIHNITDPRLLKIREINEKTETWLLIGTCAITAGMIPEPMSGVVIGAGGIVGGGGVILGAGGAVGMFKPLVQDHGPWDFKHKIKENLGEGVTLDLRSDIEYSVPGNVHYGFVGSAAGYADKIIYAGAGVAEITDPSHNTDAAKRIGVEPKPYNGDIWGAYGGDPEDYRADVFGVRLYEI